MQVSNANSTSWFRFAALFAVIVAACLLYPCILIYSGWFSSLQELGAFGEMFGALNAAFSGLAFAAIVLSLYFQYKQLHVQGEALQNSWREFQRAAEEQKQAFALSRLNAELAAIAAMLIAEATFYGKCQPGSGKFYETEEAIKRLRNKLEEKLGAIN